MAKIGVLALQGGFSRHLAVLERLGADAVLVRSKAEMESVDGLIIPGGESTTIGKLLVRYNMLDFLKERIDGGMPVFGTCAGIILLASEIVGSDQYRLGVLDITIERNAYGRQIESFEADIKIQGFDDHPIRGVFIRAPQVHRIGSKVRVLAEFEKEPVVIQRDNVLGATFHPEITNDTRLHKYLLAFIKN